MLSELLGAGSTARLDIHDRSGPTRALLAALVWGTWEIKAAWWRQWAWKLRCGFLLYCQWGEGPHGPIPALQTIPAEASLGNRSSPYTSLSSPGLHTPICLPELPALCMAWQLLPAFLSLPHPQCLLLPLKHRVLLQSKVRTEYVLLCSRSGQILPCPLRNVELDLDQAITN